MKTTQQLKECFTWTGGKFSATFDVDLAKDLVKILGQAVQPTTQWTVAMAKEALSFNTEQRDPEAVKAADCTKPIIAVQIWNERTTRHEMLIIDGWHRIEKFAGEGIGTLPCWVLPPMCAESLIIDGALPKESTKEKEE